MKFRQCLLFVIPLLGTACASLDSGTYKASEGWRTGAVEEVSTAGAMPKHAPDDCRANAAANYPASTPFALVGYRSNRMTKHRAMPLPKAMAVKVGDTVFVNLGQCDEGIAAGAAQ